jgi:hypothetical protein
MYLYVIRLSRGYWQSLHFSGWDKLGKFCRIFKN